LRGAVSFLKSGAASCLNVSHYSTTRIV